MRKLSSALILAGTLFLAGCNTTGTGGSALDQAIAQVQAYTRAYCQFEPTIASVSTLIAAGVGVVFPQASDVVTIANAVGAAICSSPKTQQFSRVTRTASETRLVRLPNGKRVAVKGKPL